MTYGIDSHRPLTTTEKGLLIAATTVAAPPLAILSGGSRLALLAWKLRPLTIPFAMGSGFDMGSIVPGGLDFLGPGGGGPGLSLTSTNPPPSVEATGASFAQHGKTEGPARSSKRGSRPRRRCKPGYRWNGHRCVPKY